MDGTSVGAEAKVGHNFKKSKYNFDVFWMEKSKVYIAINGFTLVMYLHNYHVVILTYIITNCLMSLHVYPASQYFLYFF